MATLEPRTFRNLKRITDSQLAYMIGELESEEFDRDGLSELYREERRREWVESARRRAA